MSASASWQDYKPQDSGWQDYRESSVQSPIAPPGMPKSSVNMQPESVSGFVNRMTGHEGYQGTPITPQSLAVGAAKDLGTLAAAGPQVMANLPASITHNQNFAWPLGKPDPQRVTSAGVNVGTGMLLGGLEGEGVAPTPGLNRAVNATRDVASSVPISDPSFSMFGKLARELPVVGKVLRLTDMIDAAKKTPPASNPAPTVPSTNGVQWGTGGQGPLDLRGKMIPPEPTSPTVGSSTNIPVGNLPLAKGDPYASPRTPAMEPAQSTNITQHGYDPASQTLVVQFKNGNVYEYRGVPQEVFNKYQNSESQGSFFANNIKGRYTTNLRGSVTPTRK